MGMSEASEFIEELFDEHYQLRRSVFHWVVQRWDIIDYVVGTGWVTHKRFFSRDKAVAYLVALKLQGHKVNL